MIKGTLGMALEIRPSVACLLVCAAREGNGPLGQASDWLLAFGSRIKVGMAIDGNGKGRW